MVFYPWFTSPALFLPEPSQFFLFLFSTHGFFSPVLCLSLLLPSISVFSVHFLSLLHWNCYISQFFVAFSIFLDPSPAAQFFVYPWMMVVYIRWTFFRNMTQCSVFIEWVIDRASKTYKKNKGKKKKDKKRKEKRNKI